MTEPSPSVAAGDLSVGDLVLFNNEPYKLLSVKPTRFGDISLGLVPPNYDELSIADQIRCHLVIVCYMTLRFPVP